MQRGCRRGRRRLLWWWRGDWAGSSGIEDRGEEGGKGRAEEEGKIGRGMRGGRWESGRGDIGEE